MTTQETFEVQLAIYDLSRGMARSLSAQFLGPNYAIDAIPHTGLIVYGREYFYGAGIQSEDPKEFRQNAGMFPFQVQTLGRTTVNRWQFEQWCRDAMQNGQYNAASYDLLNRNCNNFCHDAALQGLRLDKGVPDWVLQVPQRFLSSPMGQMVRPMLENMQVLNVTGAEPVAPFANAGNSLSLSTTSNSSSASTSAGTSAHTNPWANISSSSDTPSSSSQANPVQTEKQKTTQTTTKTPLLDSFTKPLLSIDTNMVQVCVTKLHAASTTTTTKETMLTENELDALQKTADVLTSDDARLLEEPLAETTCQVILQLLKTEPSNVTYALLLLRLVVLQASKDSTKECLEWLQAQLTETGGGESSSSHYLSSAASRSAAWLTVSNAAGVSLSRLASVEAFVEAAVIDISLVDDDSHHQAPPQVRQAACALLYNVALGKTVHVDEDLPDMLVSILCACLEGIDVETDDTARLRRLMVVGRIVKPSCTVNPSARGLVLDLGYKDALEQLSRSPESSGDAEKCRKLALELTDILN